MTRCSGGAPQAGQLLPALGFDRRNAFQQPLQKEGVAYGPRFQPRRQGGIVHREALPDTE